MSTRNLCNGKGNTAGPKGTRVCTRCGETKAISDFRLRPEGRPESWCRPCKNADAWDRRSPDLEPPAPHQELERLRALARPSAAEWAVVQRAAERIAEYRRAKAKGASNYEGETAWAVVEAFTRDDRRFHQLISMAVVQQKAWEEQQVGKIFTRGEHIPPELVAQVRSKRLQKWSISRIATRLRISRSAVSDILQGLTYRDVA